MTGAELRKALEGFSDDVARAFCDEYLRDLDKTIWPNNHAEAAKWISRRLLRASRAAMLSKVERK